MDCRFDSVRTKSPAATSISSEMPICPTTSAWLSVTRPEGVPHVRLACSDLFQRRYDVDARRADRRCETEEDAGQHRQRGRDAQHVPVQTPRAA